MTPSQQGIQVTGTVQREAWIDGLLPPVERVGPGIWSIPVPLPNNPLRYVLVYALELHSGLALVDAGWDTPEAWTALTKGLESFSASVADVRAVIVTHIHPDHYGLAGRVREASGAWVGLHPADAQLLSGRYGDVESLLTSMRLMAEEWGVPPEERDTLTRASLGIQEFVSLVQPDVLIEDGDRPDLPGWSLRAIWTPGHSPGHLCFYEEGRRLLLTGDHVLPRITANVAVHTQQRANPLADYLDSLRRVQRLDVDEILPAHEYRFRGLEARVSTIIAHHQARLDEILNILTTLGPLTCWDLTRQLSWSRPWVEIPAYMRRAAAGETAAHLVLLRDRGRVAAVEGRPVRWALAASDGSSSPGQPSPDRPDNPTHAV